MYIKTLNLLNFRNYKSEQIEFSPKMNIIYGANGQGKTNIAEAIYYFQSGKSFRNIKDKEIIKFGEDFAKIEATFQKNEGKSFSNIFIKDGKSINLNGFQIVRLSELVGEYNMVIFTPDFLNIIKSGPSERRQFLDQFISQVKPSYFKNLINYYRVLRQRNNILKTKDKNMLLTLDVWDEKLAKLGILINKERIWAIEKINSTINSIDEAEKFSEKIKLSYSSSIKGDFEDYENYIKNLKMSNERDFEKGMTHIGPHRDDFEIFMNGINIKKFGSQGQMRTCVLKLKLSECMIIEEKTSDSPILILDDILSELDEERRSFFLKNISDRQVIITCTEKEKTTLSDCTFFRAENGHLIKEQV